MIPGSANPLLMAAAQDTGYNVPRSLRFNAPDSAFLSRTPGSAGNRKTFTISFWLKVVNTGSGAHVLFNAQNGTSTGLANNLWLYLDSGLLVLGDGVTDYFKSANILRDPCAWYHIVLSVDTTAASAANRARVYVNNAEVVYSVDSRSSITQNADTTFSSTVTHYIGRGGSAPGYYLPGYLADIHFIDGQALTPSSFTEVSATTGQLIPKAYTGSYGTNGFKLDFSNNASTTTVSQDSSGNNNHWTANNISVSAGAGNDSLVDTPTSYGTDDGLGGSVRGNYCTYNRLNSAGTLANGNLESTPGADLNNGYAAVSSIAIPVSGKWYAEFTLSSLTSGAAFLGVIPASANGTLSNRFSIAGSYGYISINGNKRIADVDSSYGATYAAGDVIGVAVNMDNLELTFYKNNSSQGAISIASNSYIFCSSGGANSSGVTWIANFGQRPFAYTAPSGFKALCDTNLPTPVIAKPNTVFDTKLYTGNGSTQNITGLGFSPDLVWIKSRSTGTLWHEVFDVIRGANNRLFTNATNAETTNNTLSSFNSDGFTLSITDSNGYGVNLNNDSYVAWAWDAGSSNSTNNAGSITSTVRANASAGFSIVTYTGNGSAGATVGHGLGVTPGLVILKSRSLADSDWVVTHSAFANQTDNFLRLNTTGAVGTLSGVWSKTSTTFGFPTSYDGTNKNGSTYVAYCFAPVAGYTSAGSYTGNGSADGPFVYTSMRPRWILLKRTDSTGNWIIIDTARLGYNVDNNPLFPNLADAEGTTDLADILSNGFKLRSTDAAVNANTGTYIYFAISEAAFQYSRAR